MGEDSVLPRPTQPDQSCQRELRLPVGTHISVHIIASWNPPGAAGSSSTCRSLSRLSLGIEDMLGLEGYDERNTKRYPIGASPPWHNCDVGVSERERVNQR
jgi:hypothetical protein